MDQARRPGECCYNLHSEGVGTIYIYIYIYYVPGPTIYQKCLDKSLKVQVYTDVRRHTCNTCMIQIYHVRCKYSPNFSGCSTIPQGFQLAHEAKMNNRLARDLGSTARAAAFCNLTVMTWGLPMCLVLAPRLGSLTKCSRNRVWFVQIDLDL